MPKPIKKRAVKKQTSEIEVKGVISKVKASVGKDRNTFIGIVAASIIAIFVIAGFFMYSSNAKNKAAKLEYEAYKIYYGLYQKQPISKDEQYKKAAELFKKAYDTKKSPVSLFYVANCYYELGKYEDSLKALKELNQKFPDNERFVPLSYYKMAMASLKKGDNNEAIKHLEVLYNYKAGTYKDLSLIESGRILESVGRIDEAIKKYEDLAKNFPQSPFIEEAKERLESNRKR